MAFLSPARLRLIVFALLGLAFATWLTVFASDSRRPVSPMERADRLAAENILSGALTADSPPSPDHWAQLWIWQSPETGARYPLARPANALLIALSGQNPSIAGIVAFGLGATSVGWLLLAHARLGFGQCITLIGVALVCVVRGRAWQFSDPSPYVMLSAGALLLGWWLSFREEPTNRHHALCLGLSLAWLGLANPALTIAACICITLDALVICLSNKETGAKIPPVAAWLAIVAPILILLGCAAIRNQQLTGSMLVSPETDYIERATSAPCWFWNEVRIPQANLDPVMERYDETVAMSAARFEPPVFHVWITRWVEGANRSVGVLLAFAALASAFLLPAQTNRPAWLLIIALALIAVLNYSFSSGLWTFFTPPALLLAARGIAQIAARPKIANGLIGAVACGQILLIPLGTQAKATAAEYDFATRQAQISKKIAETAGDHLVFVKLHADVDGRIEPASLPRAWPNARILFARDLGPEKNARLKEAMPQRTAWTMMVFRDRIGLDAWKGSKPINVTNIHSPEGS